MLVTWLGTSHSTDANRQGQTNGDQSTTNRQRPSKDSYLSLLGFPGDLKILEASVPELHGLKALRLLGSQVCMKHMPTQ